MDVTCCGAARTIYTPSERAAIKRAFANRDNEDEKVTSPQDKMAAINAMRASGEITEDEYARMYGRLAGDHASVWAAYPAPPAVAPPVGYPPPPYTPTGAAVPPGPPRRRPKRHILRWVLVAGAAVIALIVILSITLSKKTTSTSDVATKADAPTTAATNGASTSNAPSTPARQPAHVGSNITLKGRSGEEIVMTLVAVAPTTTSTDNFSKPAAGQRYFAAQWRITNNGTAAYDDAPSNGTVATDAQGQQFRTTIVGSIAAGPLLPAATKVAPGSSALGWIVYEVPATDTITGAQFSLSSGFGSTGQWIIP